MAAHSTTNKFLLRIPNADHAALVTQAKNKNTSINQLILDKLQAAHGPTPLAEFSELQHVTSVFGSTLQGIFLFGSRARGESHQESDVDLLLLMEDNFKLDRGVYTKWDLHFAKRCPGVSPHFVVSSGDLARLASSSIWREVALDGILLWQKDFRASRLMSQLRRLLLAGGGAELRKTTHGHPYWVLNDQTKGRVL